MKQKLEENKDSYKYLANIFVSHRLLFLFSLVSLSVPTVIFISVLLQKIPNVVFIGR